MSGFARNNKGLKGTFPQSGVAAHEPGHLTEFVQLVHPIFGPLTRLGEEERTFAQATEANAQTIATMAQAPVGVVRMVNYAHANHNAAAGLHVQFQIQEANGGMVVTVQRSLYDAAGALVPQNTNYPLHRPILLGPLEQLQVFVNVGALEAISWRVAFVDYTPADVPSHY